MTLMQPGSDVLQKITFLTGAPELLARASEIPAKPLFDSQVLDFFDALSQALLHDPHIKAFSDVIAWAFWIRRASLLKVRERFEGQRRLGRGVAFHVAPSNVPVNFAVSLTSSLLAGNISIVRVSDKDFEQVRIIVSAMNSLLDQPQFHSLKDYVAIVRYPHDRAVNDFLSSVCDLRVIWGGDRTVRELRQSELPLRAIELTFPDRYSIAVIDACACLAADATATARKFFIDTYHSDQNACSSPRLVAWTGEASDVATAQRRFWGALSDLVSRDYALPPILAVDKLSGFCELAIRHPQVRRIAENNALVRVETPQLWDDLMDFKQGGGYFFEHRLQSLEELLPLLGKRCQTVSYLGVDPQALCDLAVNHGVRGVDRIVPLGRTMDLEFIWDGFSMISAMSRYVDVL